MYVIIKKIDWNYKKNIEDYVSENDYSIRSKLFWIIFCSEQLIEKLTNNLLKKYICQRLGGQKYFVWPLRTPAGIQLYTVFLHTNVLKYFQDS